MQRTSRRRKGCWSGLLLLACLLVAMLLLLGNQVAQHDLALSLPWNGGIYTLAFEPCVADQSAALALRRRPAYYQLARGSDVLRLPLTPRCP